ncbi:tumor necrosis factor receptor superfamily member 13B isoform X1 [Lepisosteus oculatus]|uniref:tumor necrosis factor receptor superfamily member 13B isoform X1 n=1 Tax=Lepisosteus oculatus TaxID=7918 RepID=UPI0007401A78|nr:PREDICTED: tumor necrosis factor receptor superfamily member 13B [Lepisosteus oculatus]
MRRCPDREYWDRLVRKCMPCKNMCRGQPQPEKCVPICATLKCEATPGTYYDELIKNCMSCSEVCGGPAPQCPETCRMERQPALSPTKRPQMDRLQDYHTVVIYSLLGCCLAALICSLSIALLILLKRCRGAETKTASFRGQEPNEYADRSSKDPLVETVLPKESSVAKGKPRPTETCIYCFPELRMAGRIEGKQTETPLVFQQAAPTTSPTTATSIPPSTLDKDRTIKIICSPSQTTSSFEIAAQH